MLPKIRKAGFEEKRFDTGEVELNFVAGPNNGLPLVLIPAQSLSWESYQRVLPELSRELQVFSVDPRGHGKSGWTPGAYSFDSMSRDIAKFLQDVVGRPAIVSGNSSGGVACVWLAANVPDQVLGIIPEDPPLFSSEWPRLKDDCFAYRLFKLITETLCEPGGRDFAAFFQGLEVPIVEKERVMVLPSIVGKILSAMVSAHRLVRPGRPVDIPLLPMEMRLLLKCLSSYDPEFTRAFVDGSGSRGFSHEEALAKVLSPMLLLHANWFRHPDYGLIGAMDDADIGRVRSLVPHCRYSRIDSGHMIHQDKPEAFIREVKAFADSLS